MPGYHGRSLPPQGATWESGVGVLLIVFANIANLFLVRAANRRREVALRMALGASRWRLGRQLFTESLLLAFCGAILGSALARSAVHALDPTVEPLELRTMEVAIQPAFSGVKAAGTFLVVLGTIALLLASLGLYAITAYAVGCRTREIGIRMALGAQGSDVCSAILGHGLRLTLVGISLGCVASLALAPLISGFLYGVNSRDPVAHFAVSGLLCVVSLAGTVLPAVSATRVDPIVTLRGD